MNQGDAAEIGLVPELNLLHQPRMTAAQALANNGSIPPAVDDGRAPIGDGEIEAYRFRDRASQRSSTV